MELKVKDVVLIEVKNNSKNFTLLEEINAKYDEGIKEYITQNFRILKRFFEVKSLLPHFDGICKLLKVWRLDENDNYIRIYPEPEEK